MQIMCSDRNSIWDKFTSYFLISIHCLCGCFIFLFINCVILVGHKKTKKRSLNIYFFILFVLDSP